MYKRMFGTVCLMLALLNGSHAVPVTSNGSIQFDGVTIDPATSPSLDFEKFTGDQSADTFFLVQVAPNAVRDAAKTFESMFAQYIPENAYIIRTNFTYARLLAQSPRVTYVNLLPAQSKITTRLESVLERVANTDASSVENIDAFFAEELKDINEAVRQVPPQAQIAPAAKPSRAASLSFSHTLPASQKHREVMLGAAFANLSSEPALTLHMIEAPVDTAAAKKQGIATLAADAVAERNAAVQAALNAAISTAYDNVVVQAASNPSMAGAMANLSKVDVQADAKAVASAAVLPLTVLVAPTDTSVKHSATMPAASSLSIHSPLLGISPSALAKDIVASARDTVLRKATVATAAATRPSALRSHLDTVAASLASEAASAPLASLSEGQQTIALARSIATVVDLQRAAVTKAVTDAVAALAELPHVLTVDVKPRIKSHNMRAKFIATIGTDSHIPAYNNDANNLYHAAGIKGAGLVVGVGDTGVDTRSCYFANTDNRATPYNTVDLAARKVVQYIPYGDRGDYVEGHGTHVAGTIAGSSTSSAMTTHDGVAPDAKIAMFDLADSAGNFYVPDNLANMYSEAWKANGHIHSDSWGCSKDSSDPFHYCNVYDSMAYYTDKWMHEHDEALVVIANGNDGDLTYGSVGTPATAKNALSVGALSSSGTSFTEQSQGKPSLTRYSTKTMAYFSSLGPTIDYRLKPDVVAPGYSLTSARASGDSSSTCATTVMGGTSMATPTVSGTAALLTDYLKKGLFASPASPMSVVHGTLLKAILVNSAQTVDYLSANADLIAMPMKSQSTGGGSINNFTRLPLGRLTSLKGYSDNTAQLYFQPSSGGGSTRSYRLIINDGCGASYSASFGTTTAANTATRTAGGSPYDPNPMDWENVPVSSSTLYLKFTSSVAFAQCSFLNIGILEFDSATVASAPSSAVASCSDTVEFWPDFDHDVNRAYSDGTSVLPTYRFSCPAAPACSDAHANGRVQGTSAYTTSTPVCRAALHNAAVNNIDANRVLSSTEISNWVATQPRGLVTVNRYILDGQPNQYVPVKADVANGVTSASVRIYGGSQYITLARAGAASVPAGVTSSSPFPNDMELITSSPNHISGFGKVTLATAAPLGTPASGAARKLAILSDGSKGMTHQSARVQCFTIGEIAQATTMNSGTAAVAYSPGPDNVKVTLVWNDYAGFPTSSKRTLVNDLDLFVFGPDGDEYRGNDRVDKRNTVEQVTLTAKRGVYCAAVHGAYVPLGEAKYSLVVNGRSAATCPASPLAPGVTLGGRWTRFSSPSCTNTAMTPNFPADLSIVQAGGCSIIRPTPSTTNNACATDAAANLFGLRRSACDSEDYRTAELGAASTSLGAAWSASGAITSGTAACSYLGTWTDGSRNYEACFDITEKTATITWTSGGNTCTGQYGLEEDNAAPVYDVQSEFIKNAQYLIPVPTVPNAASAAQVFVSVMCALAAAFAMLW